VAICENHASEWAPRTRFVSGSSISPS
jgi:hypothetical protein